MSIKLTPKQKKVLELIYNSLETSGFPPTLADLKEKLGVASNQSILNFLDNLEKKECIKREEGQARGIRILPLGYKEIGKDPLIKMVGVSAAGSYIESFADTFSSWITLPGQVLQNEEIKQAQDEVFVIQVQGDSMINANICDSDMLLVKKTKEYKNGDIVVARSDDGTTVKRFVAEEGRTYLKPENPNYKNIPIFPETIFEGKVILNLTKVNT